MLYKLSLHLLHSHNWNLWDIFICIWCVRGWNGPLPFTKKIEYQINNEYQMRNELHTPKRLAFTVVFCECHLQSWVHFLKHLITCLTEFVLGIFSVITYLGMVERFRGDDPRFWDFRSDWVYILYLSTIRLTPSFCRKKSVCLYHI